MRIAYQGEPGAFSEAAARRVDTGAALLPIIGEIELPVVHHLLALPGSTLERVRRIYSHPQALAQCDRFLRTLSGVEVIATYDTAGSAKLIADEKMQDAAAIASERAAAVFGLVALRSSIQDYEHNV